MISVSVIVPVYNAEKYLRSCLDSIIHQTLTEIEIVVVNDGSTDQSGNIVLEYCERDKRIVLIDSENKGVSAARNLGIRAARAPYIGFVDADDTIASAMYETMLNAIEKVQGGLVICGAYSFSSSGTQSDRIVLTDELNVINENERPYIIAGLLKFKYDYANWNKLYDASIIRNNKLLFDERMTIWEDLLFNMKYINFANAMIQLKDKFYYYRVHEASVMGNTVKGIADQYNLLYNNYEVFCADKKLFRELEIFKSDRAETCVNNLLHFLKEKKNARPGFAAQFNMLTNELKTLEPKIYLQQATSPATNKWQHFLLAKRMIKPFVFFFIGERELKRRVKMLIGKSHKADL